MTITPCANIHCPACSLFPEQLNGSGRALWTQAPRIPQNFIFRFQLLTGDQFLHCGPHLLIPTQILHIFPPVPIRFRYSPDCVFSSQGNTNVDIWTSDVNLYGFVNLLSHYVSDEHERATKTPKLIQIWRKKIEQAAAAHFDFLSLTPCTSRISVFVAVFCWRAHVSFCSKRWKVAKCVYERCRNQITPL